MRKHINKIGLVSSTLALVMLSGSAVFALPPQANAHALATSSTAPVQPNQSAANHSTTPSQASQKGQAGLAKGQLLACKNREVAIKNIINRIDTRAQNQISLFATIASRVEALYVKQGKTVANYSQLVAAMNTAKAQAETDFGTLKTNSSFSCSASNPKGMVASFQSYLKTEISDLQAFRTSVKNLIVAVATANGVKLSSSSQSSGTTQNTSANQGSTQTTSTKGGKQ